MIRKNILNSNNIFTHLLVFPQIRGFPTIKMFAAGKKDGEASEYDGGRTSADIVTWALDKASENIPPPEIKQVFYYPCRAILFTGSPSAQGTRKMAKQNIHREFVILLKKQKKTGTTNQILDTQVVNSLIRNIKHIPI